MPDTNTENALRAIQRAGRGWAFSQRDFAQLGSRAAIDKALQRLARRGTIRRAVRGVYDYPRFSKLLDQDLSPDTDSGRSSAGPQVWLANPAEWPDCTEHHRLVHPGARSYRLPVRWTGTVLPNRQGEPHLRAHRP